MSGEIRNSRRDVLKKVGAGALVPFAGFNRQRAEMVKLPELMNSQGVVKWMEVPKAWAAHLQHARNASDALKQKYLKNDTGVVEVGLIGAPERFGGKRGLQVEIGVDKARLTSELPDHVDDIPIQTVEKPEPPVPIACKNSSYNKLPGGVEILVEDGSDTRHGTSGWKVKDTFGTAEGETLVVTATHVVTETTGKTVYGDLTNGSYQKVGEVSEYFGRDTLDVAAISTSRDIPNKIIGESSTYSIGGWVHNDGICERASDAFDGYRKMGITTGETTGGIGKCEIGDSYSSSTPSYFGDGVRGSADAAVGDSGGPAFSLHDGDAYITHMITHGDPKAGQNGVFYDCHGSHESYEKSLGPAAYRINDEHWEIIGTSHS